MNIYKNLFPGGKQKCLTFSYDDGSKQDAALADLFRKYGLKATFNINGHNVSGENKKISKEEFLKIYDGFEIACHGYVHPQYALMPTIEVANDIIKDRKSLEDIMGAPVTGMALPSGSFNADTLSVIKSCGISYVRPVTGTFEFFMPADFMTWYPTIKHDNPRLLELGNKFLGKWHWNTSLPGLMYVWGHSYELDSGNMWQTIEDFMKMMSGNDEIWYASNIEVVSYWNALQSIVTSADGTMIYNPSLIDVWVTVGGEKVEIKSGELKKL